MKFLVFALLNIVSCTVVIVKRLGPEARRYRNFKIIIIIITQHWFYPVQCFRCEAYSFAMDGYGIFNVRTSLGACRTHEGGQAQISLHKS